MKQQKQTDSAGCQMQNREQQILDHMSLIYYVMQQISLTLPAGMEADDLLQYGCIGLIEAVDAYRKPMGRFSTFAVLRIRGAMLDGIFKFSWMTRSQSRDARRWSDTKAYLEERMGRPVEEEEVSRFLNLKPKAGEGWKRLGSLSVVYRDGEEEAAAFSFFEAQQNLYWTDESDEKESLQRAISRLSSLEQRLLTEYYFDQKSMCGFAQENALSFSCVYKLHRKALKKLRKWLKA